MLGFKIWIGHLQSMQSAAQMPCNTHALISQTREPKQWPAPAAFCHRCLDSKIARAECDNLLWRHGRRISGKCRDL